MTRPVEDILKEACGIAGIDASGAELIRAGENYLYRLRGLIVARVTRPGQIDSARKEVKVSRWLVTAGLPVVEVLPNVVQPVELDRRAITFWRQLSAHHKGSYLELAQLLRKLHNLPLPEFELPPLAPFVRVRERLHEAFALPDDDRQWLLGRLETLEASYAELPTTKTWCAVHGDAWIGNVASTSIGPVLLDLERFAYGPPEWDLVSVAVGYTTFGAMTAPAWDSFCDRYGYDVTVWEGFEVLRDIRELRKVTFAWQFALDRTDIAEQARYRLACLRGQHGDRPWRWSGVP
ncbi:aminoglycoside phosphotransferase [Rhizocola hellebori]|uniref:Aminoglycoside phosphotransferase n=1 Tax=Rhizocola hellebori TaxID=1392758 RepID=A0A8J3VKU3_9ACTN|nr:aminoglycoside phosphotransferase family protein [Rhizocola hellebori]GIH09401.1 aminoglycoside phosphotransferase [Rhizocola hellebori]